MKVNATRIRRKERGVALIIAIFTMMLITVVATALILMAGTASAVKTNYKNSMQAFYDARAGLEEGRGRLFQPDSGAKTCIVSAVCYVTNPDTAAGETAVTPWSSTDPYYDTEYDQEFGSGSLATATKASVASTWQTQSISGPVYKWVRITAATEPSLGINPSGGNPVAGPLLYFDGNNTAASSSGPPSGTAQILEVTALAVTPGGGYSGRRLLQYTVAQNPNGNPLSQGLTSNGSTPTLNQILPAALTLDGNSVAYSAGSTVAVNGNDGSGSAAPNAGVPAIVYTNTSDTKPTCNCLAPTGMQSIQTVSLPTSMQTPAGLDGLATAITQNAAAVITPASGIVADQTSLPSAMSAANPLIVVVNGDFHLSHVSGSPAFVGYGLLLVTGNFYYDPDDSWNGIILVIGKGVLTNNSQSGSNGQINGAVLVANTRDRSTGALLSSLGPASVNLTGGGNGIRYNSSFVNNVQAMVPYSVLSFREIALTQ